MKIVIVDDSRAMRMIIKKTLRQAGYGHANLREADNGRSAAELVQAEPPHLVLTDWNMPGVGGLELLQWLQEAQFGGVAGVISSSATSKMRQQAATAGAKFVIAKPFTPARFKAVLEQYGFKSEGGDTSTGSAKWIGSYDAAGVQGALAGAFRREIGIKAVAPARPRGRFVQVGYQTPDGAEAIAICERQLALSLGAALSLIPAGVVRDAMDGQIPSVLQGNIREVFNLLVRVVQTGTALPQMGDVDFDVESPRPPKSGHRLDLQVSVDGYGEGRLTLVKP